MLNKCSTWFTCTTDKVFLGHCAVSPLFSGAVSAMRSFTEAVAEGGITALPKYSHLLPEFRETFGSMLKTTDENISYVPNTATAMSMIANGYPFEPGDQVISYAHEYPSNHYPWVLQQERGVELILLSDVGDGKSAASLQGWSMEELERRVTGRTRIVAISHVQFASGFAADLADLGAFCKARNIDLIVDCAQSLGCLPVYPEEYNIAALASSGWKWLMGPLGGGVMYTSSELRKKLKPVLTGPGMMRQEFDYLDHSWDPYEDGRRFEFSTGAWDHIAALQAAAAELFLTNSMENIRDEVFRLQDVFIDHLDRDRVSPLILSDHHRSGIVMLRLRGRSRARDVMAAMQERGVVITGPTGVLRLAPHFYMSDSQMIRGAEILNTVLRR
ncbi:aminotransferase class V-fold PLP-dependent enzyme [Desulfopila aestuarii]|nr:aminotransferase class V-fold PLP-dependent enzyme [Desulfopila aestuarii]